jgi:CRP-like cAMP-binding protein
MNANERDALGPLVRKLDRLGALTPADKAVLEALPFTVRQTPAGQYLVREGAPTTECCMLVTGYACRHKVAANGGRQIVSFHLAGDILDLQHLLLAVADHNVQTITDATVAWIPKVALKRAADGSARIADALWRDTLIDASIFREWVLNVGRRDARSRTAHMLCEFAARREAAADDAGADRRRDRPHRGPRQPDAARARGGRRHHPRSPPHPHRRLAEDAPDRRLRSYLSPRRGMMVSAAETNPCFRGT